jgi:hypothetical protein
MHGSRSKIPSKKSRQVALRGGFNSGDKGLIRSFGRRLLNSVSCKWSRTLLIRNADYPDCLGPLVKFVENPTNVTCLDTADFRIKYSTL